MTPGNAHRDDRPARSVDPTAQAADWLVRQQGGWSPAEEAACARWRAADPRHAAAWQDATATWDYLHQPQREGRAQELAAALGQRQQARLRRRRHWLIGGLGLAVTAAAFTLAFRSADTRLGPAPNAATAAATAAVIQTLPDGSEVLRQGGARIEVAYTATARTIRLTEGEARFRVRKEAGRPFVVHAGGVEVRAVGTTFSVRHAGGQVGVVVTEGRVAVQRTPDPAAPAAPAAPPTPIAWLDAGAQLVLPATSAPAAKRAPAAAAAPATAALAPSLPSDVPARLELTGTPLGEVVERLNRTNRRQIVLGEAALRTLRLSGLYVADDPDGFVRLLEAGLNIRAERRGDTLVLYSKE